MNSNKVMDVNFSLFWFSLSWKKNKKCAGSLSSSLARQLPSHRNPYTWIMDKAGVSTDRKMMWRCWRSLTSKLTQDLHCSQWTLENLSFCASRAACRVCEWKVADSDLSKCWWEALTWDTCLMRLSVWPRCCKQSRENVARRGLQNDPNFFLNLSVCSSYFWQQTR